MTEFQTPGLRLAVTLDVEVGNAVETGRMARGVRRLVPILGGTARGPLFHGVVLPGGNDAQIVRDDGVTEIRARYIVRTADGDHVFVEHVATRHSIDGATYNRGFMHLAGDGPTLVRLDRTMFLTTGGRVDGRVHIDVFEVE